MSVVVEISPLAFTEMTYCLVRLNETGWIGKTSVDSLGLGVIHHDILGYLCRRNTNVNFLEFSAQNRA